jgi:hypothetical protein
MRTNEAEPREYSCEANEVSVAKARRGSRNEVTATSPKPDGNGTHSGVTKNEVMKS